MSLLLNCLISAFIQGTHSLLITLVGQDSLAAFFMISVNILSLHGGSTSFPKLSTPLCTSSVLPTLLLTLISLFHVIRIGMWSDERSSRVLQDILSHSSIDTIEKSGGNLPAAFRLVGLPSLRVAIYLSARRSTRSSPLPSAVSADPILGGVH